MLRTWHRTNALLLGVFIVAHLVNHLSIIGGAGTHIAIMEVLRAFYRPIVVEAILYLLFCIQILLGVLMMLRHGRPRNKWGWAQYVSGGVLAVFLLQHMSAALLTRVFSPDVETNVYWTAAVVSRPPFVWYFAPYYALGIVSLFVHVAAALRKRAKLKAYANWIIAAGLMIAAIVVPSLMGWYGVQIDLPPEHIGYIENFYSGKQSVQEN